LYVTPDLISPISPQDSAYGTGRTVSSAPRCPEELRGYTTGREVEDMDETIVPSGTVDPNKAVDNIGDVAPSHTLESSGEDFSASSHMHRRPAPLRRTSVPNKSTKFENTRVIMQSSGEVFSASPHRHGRASPLHLNVPLAPRHTESQKTTNNSSFSGRAPARRRRKKRQRL